MTGQQPSVTHSTRKIMTSSSRQESATGQRMTSSTQRAVIGSSRESIGNCTNIADVTSGGEDHMSSSARTATTSSHTRLSQDDMSNYGLTMVISGACLLNSLEKMERNKDKAQIRGVKLVLHRPKYN